MDSWVGSTGGEAFWLRGKSHAWTKQANHSDSRVSWIKQWEKATGLRREECSYENCPLRAEVGGHVWIKKMGMFIVPICKTCNDRTNTDRMEQANGHHSFLSRGTVCLKTHGAPNDNRRVADCSETKLCIDCSCNISIYSSDTRCIKCEETYQRMSALFAPYFTF